MATVVMIIIPIAIIGSMKYLSIITHLLLLVFITVGYASSDKERGDLSEAVEKSNDNYEGERKVEDTKIGTYDCDDEEENTSFFCALLQAIFTRDDEEDDYDEDYIRTENRSRYKRRERNSRERDREERYESLFGITFSTGFHYKKRFSNPKGFNFRLSQRTTSRKIHTLEFGYAYTPITGSNIFNGSTNHFSNIFAGYLFRYYFTPEHLSFGQYFSFRSGGKISFWKYNNPIFSDVYDDFGTYIKTDEIDSDGLLSLSSSIGTGLTFFEGSTLRPSVGIEFGGIIHSPETIRSFNNDIFRGDLFMKLNITMEFTFGL